MIAARTLFLTMCLFTAAGFCSAAAVAADMVLIPGAIVMPDGTLVDDKAVIIRNGRIHAVEDAARHDDNQDAVRRPGTMLSPGLIDPYSVLGVYGGNIERVHAIDPALSVIDAINASDPTFHDALAGGVTSAMLVPGANNLVAGTTAVVRTGNDRRPPEALREHAMLMFSFGSPALQPNRAPTSRAGAMTMLRNAFAEARDERGHERLQQVAAGKISVLVRADQGEDVAAALRFFETYGIGATIVHSDDLLEVREEIIEAMAPMIIGPYSTDSPHHVLIAPARLHRAGVELAFAGHTPVRDAASLRLSAALAVRAGLDSAAARRGLTINPAKMLGVDDRVGSIAPGRDADLVLFTADPLQPEARVLEVYLRGELVYVAPHLHDEIARLDPDEDSDETVIGASDDDAQ